MPVRRSNHPSRRWSTTTWRPRSALPSNDSTPSRRGRREGASACDTGTGDPCARSARFRGIVGVRHVLSLWPRLGRRSRGFHATSGAQTGPLHHAAPCCCPPWRRPCRASAAPEAESTSSPRADTESESSPPTAAESASGPTPPNEPPRPPTPAPSPNRPTASTLPCGRAARRSPSTRPSGSTPGSRAAANPCDRGHVSSTTTNSSCTSSRRSATSRSPRSPPPRCGTGRRRCAARTVPGPARGRSATGCSARSWVPPSRTAS